MFWVLTTIWTASIFIPFWGSWMWMSQNTLDLNDTGLLEGYSHEGPLTPEFTSLVGLSKPEFVNLWGTLEDPSVCSDFCSRRRLGEECDFLRSNPQWKFVWSLLSNIWSVCYWVLFVCVDDVLQIHIGNNQIPSEHNGKVLIDFSDHWVRH